jgi:uncharacterized membrane protein
MATSADGADGLAGSIRRLPERWVLAVASRRPAALFLVLLAFGLGCWGLSAITDASGADSLAWILLAFVVSSGIGHHFFRRRLAALEEERRRFLEGASEQTSPDLAPQTEAATFNPKRTTRNPRSAEFLSMSTPTAEIAKSLAVLLFLVVVIVFSRPDRPTDWFGILGLAHKFLVVALSVLVAFERVGFHQAISRRTDEIARLRRELARASRPSSTPA